MPLDEKDYDAWTQASVAESRAFLRLFSSDGRGNKYNDCLRDTLLSTFSVDNPVGSDLDEPLND